MNGFRWFVIPLTVFLVTGCDSPRDAASPPNEVAAELVSKAEPTLPSVSPLSAELSDMYLGLIQDTASHPDRNAVDAFAKAFKWKPIPPEMYALVSGKSGTGIGYGGKVAGSTVLLGSDGSRDIFSIAVRDQFEPEQIVRALREVITARKLGADESMGGITEMYRIADGSTDLGILSVSYGTAPSIRGSGAVSYISAERARTEKIGVPSIDDAEKAFFRGDYARVLQLLQPLAVGGNAEAQYNLGTLYSKGLGVPRSDVKALTWFRKAAEQEHAKAQFNLGVSYANGSGVVANDFEAFSWYQKAARNGFAAAQYNVGALYSAGRGVRRDDVEGLNWYRKAAEQGYASAQYNLGNMYSEGRGVSQNYVEATKWYRKAAEQGDAGAQHNLGVSYANGEGVQQDYVQAYLWFAVAAAVDERSIADRNGLRKAMSPAQVAKGEMLASEWRARKAAPP